MAVYNGEHSIIFGPTDGSAGKHTWEDWFLIPTSRPTMAVPQPQNNFVDIPGMNGSYDFSDYLTTDLVFSDRSGSFEFIVDNNHADWITIYRMVVSYLHGHRLRMILEDDKEWYYEGRFTVSSFKSDPNYSVITIDYRVGPFKYSIYPDFTEDVIWDTFCFERDEDWSMFHHLMVDGSFSHEIESFGVGTHVRIKLVSGGPITASFGGVTKALSTIGVQEDLGYGDQFGTTELTLSGNGVVDIGWQKVSL